jgi:glycerophosphoryl diester phosphodiesterase
VENPWLHRRVVAFAHQGGAHEAPSSTLYAVRHALRTGATALELDVHATKDRQIVVCHDETVDRTTNAVGEISNLTLAELREMDNAYWFIEGDAVTPGRAESEYQLRGRAPADRSFAIATLEEISEAAPGVVLNIGHQANGAEVEPYEQLLADELRRLGRTDSVIVASFSDDAIGAFRAVAPRFSPARRPIETAQFYFAVRAGETPAPLAAIALQVPATYGEITLVDEQFVEAAHRANVAVHVWTINEEAEMARLVDLGVDGIITDRPTPLVSLLRERGVAWDGKLSGLAPTAVRLLAVVGLLLGAQLALHRPL